jgi:hypothetical protein
MNAAAFSDWGNMLFMDAIEASPLPETADPALHELYRRWACLARGGHIPLAEEMKFHDIVARNPGAALIEISYRADGTPRYFYKQAGPAHRAILGRDVEGYWLDEIVDGDQIAQYERVYKQVMTDVRPHYWMRLNTPVGSDLFTFERMLVPISSDGNGVDSMIGVWVWIGRQPS